MRFRTESDASRIHDSVAWHKDCMSLYLIRPFVRILHLILDCASIYHEVCLPKNYYSRTRRKDALYFV
jgi:hypothetical protein